MMNAEFTIVDEPNKFQLLTSRGGHITIEIQDLELEGRTLVTWSTKGDYEALGQEDDFIAAKPLFEHALHEKPDAVTYRQYGYLLFGQPLQRDFRTQPVQNQILLQGGLHPDLGIEFYEGLFRWIKETYPIWIHGLSPAEIHHICRVSKLSVEERKMRVPTRSAGSRSGVNWMRLTLQSMDLAKALASMVLPTPGTSSMSRCPSASKQTSALRTASG